MAIDKVLIYSVYMDNNRFNLIDMSITFDWVLGIVYVLSLLENTSTSELCSALPAM